MIHQGKLYCNKRQQLQQKHHVPVGRKELLLTTLELLGGTALRRMRRGGSLFSPGLLTWTILFDVSGNAIYFLARSMHPHLLTLSVSRMNSTSVIYVSKAFHESIRMPAAKLYLTIPGE